MSVELVKQVPLEPLNQELVDALWAATRTVEEMPEDLVTSVVVSTDEELRRVNKEYRDKDKPTDVLSFRYDDTTAEILLSADRVRAQAIEYGVTQEEEAAFLVVHGFLHNAGWDHERSEQEAKEMRAREEKILSLCNLHCAR